MITRPARDGLEISARASGGPGRKGWSDADLPDVVEERAELELEDVLEPSPRRPQRGVRDPTRVGRRVLSFRFDVRQRLDRPEERALILSKLPALVSASLDWRNARQQTQLVR
jgi:hypothetical protein